MDPFGAQGAEGARRQLVLVERGLLQFLLSKNRRLPFLQTPLPVSAPGPIANSRERPLRCLLQPRGERRGGGVGRRRKDP